MSKRYIVWPYFKDGEEWTAPDAMLRILWRKMVDEGNAKTVFYSGNVQNEEDWLVWCQAPSNRVLFVADTDKTEIVFVAWLNNFSDGFAYGHFCSFGGGYRKEVGELVMETWKQTGMLGIIGVLPETNKPARKMIEHLGFKHIGEVPRLAHLKYEDRRVGAAIYHFQYEE